MLAILANTLEDAQQLSDGLQHYWNANGVYQSILLFEMEAEFFSAMQAHPYASVILQCRENPQMLIPAIQRILPTCKIAVVTDSKDSKKDNEIALACYDLGVETTLSLTDFELPLTRLSKKLHII